MGSAIPIALRRKLDSNRRRGLEATEQADAGSDFPAEHVSVHHSSAGASVRWISASGAALARLVVSVAAMSELRSAVASGTRASTKRSAAMRRSEGPGCTPCKGMGLLLLDPPRQPCKVGDGQLWPGHARQKAVDRAGVAAFQLTGVNASRMMR